MKLFHIIKVIIYFFKYPKPTANNKTLNLTICTLHQYHVFPWLTLFVELSWMEDKPYGFNSIHRILTMPPKPAHQTYHHLPQTYHHLQTPFPQVDYAVKMTDGWTTKKGPLLLKLQIKLKSTCKTKHSLSCSTISRINC